LTSPQQDQPEAPIPDAARRPGVKAMIVCGLLITLFGALSFTGSRTKSPTFDEPLHVAGGLILRTSGDTRVNPEDPPLLGLLASMLVSRDALPDGYQANPFWGRMLQNFPAAHWPFITASLFRTPGVDGAAMVRTARPVFVIIGMALGALIAAWSWKLGGATAAIIASALYSLDPNFIGHSGIVKNDVALGLLMLGFSMSVWHFGRSGSIRSFLAIVAVCVLAINVKFSGIMFLPLLVLMLGVRAMLPFAWTVGGKELRTRLQRLAVAPLAAAVVGLVCYASIWAVYGFRFDPTNNPNERFDTRFLITRIRHDLIVARTGSDANITPAMMASQPPGLLPDAMIWAESRRLLPQAWIAGFLYTYSSTLYRVTYLLGELKLTGWWYYFPLAMIFKTAVGTWLALLAALAVGSYLIAERRHRHLETAWSALCLFAPFAIYLLSAMTSNLNIGFRHVLPLYPLMYVAAGTLLAEGVRRWRSPMIKTLMGIAMLLILETALSWPNYIAFFNFAVGGTRGGIDLLGDSNLDWGQDLPLVKRWQDQHPDIPLAFGPLYTDPRSGSYFGTVPPEFYGIRADPLPPGAPSEELARTHVLAVSATMLQDIYVDGYEGYRHFKPIAILGGTIYLYDLRPAETRKAIR
jgi:hypothetical protein